MAPEHEPPPRPETISRLQSGVASAYALLAGMDLGVFTVIGARAATAEEVAAALGVDADRLARLLRALTLTGLLLYFDGRFRNSAEASAYLVKGSARYIGGAHELLAELWRADLNTAASIRSGRPEAAHDFSHPDPAAAAAFLRGLVPAGLAFGEAVAAEIDLSERRSVIDIGGGPGSALAALAKRGPHLTLTLLELPQILPFAQAILADQGLDGRIAFDAGDITRAPASGLHDLALLKALVQVLAPEDAARAILYAGRSLAPGGMICISGGGVLDDNRLAPRDAVFLNLTFLNLYPRGESYTEAQHRAWLAAAGFADIRRVTLSTGSEAFFATKAD